MQNLINEVRQIFDSHAQDVFLIEHTTGRQLTYEDFYHMAASAAGQMLAQGIGRQQRVALLLNNSAEFAAFYFACLFIGAVAVPVNPSLNPREVAFILTHSDVRLIVCSPSTKKLLQQADADTHLPAIYLLPENEKEMERDGSHAWFQPGIEPPVLKNWQPLQETQDEDIFSITFTSGTTSMPKGVTHGVYSLLKNAQAFDKALQIDAENRFFHTLPMAYMAGFLNNLLCPFMAGSSVVLMPQFDARMALFFWKPVIQYAADTFWLVPSMLNSLLKLDRGSEGAEYCRHHVKTLCTCTAPLPLKTKRDFEQKYGIEIFNSYGLSELLIITCASKDFSGREESSVGPLLPGNKIRIIDSQGEVLPTGVDGEIQILTPYAMKGYLNYDTLEPDEIDPADWFSTGDAGHVDEHGQLFITGRQKDLIVRGGMNISPKVVEDVLLEHEAVDQAAVVGLPHDFYGEEVAAAVILKTNISLAEIKHELDALCKQKLNAHSLPAHYFIVAEFPVNATGKVQKNKLKHILVEKQGIEINPKN